MTEHDRRPQRDGGQASPPPIQQFLHGYDGGHRLLAGSAPLLGEVRRLVDRLSDAAGSRPDPSIDGYLTGYPVPDGRYALARTWYAWELPRPNCVWTHTVILEDGLLDNRALVRDLIGWLHRPSGPIDAYKTPLQAPGPPRTDLSQERPGVMTSVPIAALAGLLDELYHSDRTPVCLEAKDVHVHEALVLGIWDQQWPQLRRQFSFCVGALEPRSLSLRSFDLSVVPVGRGSAFRGSRASDDGHPSAEGRFLVDDLLMPSTTFRKYVTFSAAGSSRRSTLAALTCIWLALAADASSTAEVMPLLGDEIRQLAPQPRRMRRLKRFLFRPPEAAVAVKVSPVRVLRELVAGPLATAVATEDVLIGRWTELVWSRSPATALATYRAAPVASANPRREGGQSAVAETARLEVGGAIADICQPVDMPTVARVAPELILSILRRRLDGELWQAWMQLPNRDIRVTLGTGASQGATLATSFAIAACRALETATLPLSRVRAVWELLLERDRRGAVGALIAVLGSEAMQSVGRWHDLLLVQGPALAALLMDGLPVGQLMVIAEVIEPDEGVVRMGLQPWEPLCKSERLNELTRGLAVLMVVGLSYSDWRAPSVGRVFAHLYERFSSAEATKEWELLCAHTKLQSYDWDRCRRLTEQLARRLADWSAEQRSATVEAARLVSEESAAALARGLRPRRRTRSILPLSW